MSEIVAIRSAKGKSGSLHCRLSLRESAKLPLTVVMFLPAWPASHFRGANGDTRLIALLAALLLLVFPSPSPAQVTPPNYDECRLIGIFPAGGRRGETVTVELESHQGGIEGAREILIDGPPGISVKELKNLSTSKVQAKFVIAADAPLGRRSIRVISERSGITNMLYFTVGRMPETLEKEPNNETSAAQAVTLPIIVNGRVDPKADQDCFAFDLKKGQRIVAAVLAHALESHGQYKNYGYVDATLELLDSRGRVVAEAGDTIGLDPQVEYTAPVDGRFTARVRLEAYEGFPQATYRLVLGEVSLATSVFPPGGRRGTIVDVELAGPLVSPGTRQKINLAADNPTLLRHILPDDPKAGDLELPFVIGELPERLEAEPNDKLELGTPLEVGMTANARFERTGDSDWYRVKLTAGLPVLFETTAQRFLRSPVDSRIEITDPTGKKLAENDDGFALDYISMHDFRVMDSRLVFRAPTTGEYFVKVTDQSGGGGPRSVYRLTVKPFEPGFELFLYPDGVPIWGPGTTAGLLVKVDRDDFGGDVELRIEGLPTGWIGTQGVNRGPASTPPQTYPYRYHFLTLTAPADAKVGTIVPFTIVGKAKIGDRVAERTAKPVTLYYSSDTGHFRITPQARAVVAKPQTPWISSTKRALRVPQSGTVEIPVDVHGPGKFEMLDMNADMATSGVATALSAPRPVAVRDGKATFSLKLPDHIGPGNYDIMVALRWRSDIRTGMPGPCTQLIRLEVFDPKK